MSTSSVHRGGRWASNESGAQSLWGTDMYSGVKGEKKVRRESYTVQSDGKQGAETGNAYVYKRASASMDHVGGGRAAVAGGGGGEEGMKNKGRRNGTPSRPAFACAFARCQQSPARANQRLSATLQGKGWRAASSRCEGAAASKDAEVLSGC
mmetsp:Transcript_18407/g.31752  ORF Transcript_18407/g.31752 Transcript_18407/m.31752 type:complete len:152 (+) Transcript_18407:168-623(+)